MRLWDASKPRANPIFGGEMQITLLFIITSAVLLSLACSPAHASQKEKRKCGLENRLCCHPFKPKLKPRLLNPRTHALPRNLLKTSHHVNTNKGSVVKQSSDDVEGCRSQKILFQPSMRAFLQYSVNTDPEYNSVRNVRLRQVERII